MESVVINTALFGTRVLVAVALELLYKVLDFGIRLSLTGAYGARKEICVSHDSASVKLVGCELGSNGASEEIQLPKDFGSLDGCYLSLVTDERTGDHIEDVPNIIVDVDVSFNLNMGVVHPIEKILNFRWAHRLGLVLVSTGKANNVEGGADGLLGVPRELLGELSVLLLYGLLTNLD